MGSTTVRAEIIIAAKAEGVVAEFAKIGKAGDQMGKDIKNGAGGAISALTGINLGALSVVGGLTALGGALKYAIGEAMAAETTMAATEAVIKSTGGAAQMSAGQISGLATDISRMTGLADDVVASGENILLTFTNIKGADTFERTTKAMTDMSVAMNKGSLEGIDLKASALQLGKALNDPIKGMTALTRVGVTFTQEQKDMVRAMMELGDTAGAQAVILAELEKEFGGMAEAAGDTTAGSISKLKNELGELVEEVGTVFLPAITAGADASTGFLRYFQDGLAAVQAGRISLAEYYATAYQVALTSKTVADATADFNQKLEDQAVAALAANDNTMDYGVRLGDLVPAQQDYVTALSDTKLGYENMGAAANGYVEALDPVIAAQDKLTLGMTAYNEQLLFQIATEGMSAEQKLHVAGVMGLLDQRTLTAAATVEELTRKYDLNHDGIVDNTEATKGYYGELLHLQNQMNSMQDKTVNLYMNTTYTSTYLEDYRAATGGGRAAGGPVQGGQSYVVGEQGREIFTPATDGTITPNSKIGEGAGVTVIIENITVPNGDARAISQQIAAELRRALRSGVAGVGV